MMNKNSVCCFLLCLLFCGCGSKKNGTLVFQTDFGLKDGAVSAMKGVANTVSPDLRLFDLTHEIPAYNIWEGAYRLEQTARYWPAGTVFVSVVDPGVGTDRKSVVLKTKSGHFFVSPDNGTLGLVSESLGIEAVREIDSVTNRREGSSASYTFHGRDVYAYTGARLASGAISFEQVGKELKPEVIRLAYQKPVSEDNSIKGNIPILDVQYGNIWSNIPDSLVFRSAINYGDSVAVKIFLKDSVIYSGKMALVHTFGEVKEGEDMAYFNSLMNFSLAINMGNFAEKYHVMSGPDWTINISRITK